VGLVYSLTPKPVEHHMAWYARPKVIAVGLIAMLIALNLIFR
jgi:SSS family solute:Na+ symporter